MSRSTTTSRLMATAALTALALGAGPTILAQSSSAVTTEEHRNLGAALTGTSAGTITYIKNHNVWIARGDGSGARAVTTNGSYAAPYGSPSQSDNGVVVATHGTDIVRMKQSGVVLNRLDPKPLPTSVGVSIDGSPVDAAISPNGVRIAYTFTKYLTPSGASSGFRSATGYTAADRLTDPAPHRSTYFWSPSWVGNSRTLQSGGYGSQIQIQDLGSNAVHWFDDSDIYAPSTDLGNAELSRDGKSLAAVRGYGDDAAIYWYAVNGNAQSGPAPADPTPLCQIGPAAGITNPTWAPDSDSLAWEESDGIWTRRDARDCSTPSTLILRGGSQPHWSPAPLSAATARVLKNIKAPTLRGTARVGRTLKASVGTWSPSGLRYDIRWLRNGTAIKKGGLSYRITRADRGKKLSLRVTASKSGYPSKTASSRAVRVKR